MIAYVLMNKNSFYNFTPVPAQWNSALMHRVECFFSRRNLMETLEDCQDFENVWVCEVDTRDEDYWRNRAGHYVFERFVVNRIITIDEIKEYIINFWDEIKKGTPNQKIAAMNLGLGLDEFLEDEDEEVRNYAVRCYSSSIRRMQKSELLRKELLKVLQPEIEQLIESKIAAAASSESVNATN